MRKINSLQTLIMRSNKLSTKNYVDFLKYIEEYISDYKIDTCNLEKLASLWQCLLIALPHNITYSRHLFVAYKVMINKHIPILKISLIHQNGIQVSQPKFHEKDKVLNSRARREINMFNLPEMKRSDVKNCASNSPPQIGSQTKTFLITPNQFSHFIIPSNLFFDQDDGDTRQLQLALAINQNPKPSDFQWFQFNPLLQLVYTWMTYDTALQQPEKGYAFKLTATDTCKASATTLIYLKSKTKLYIPFCYYDIFVVKNKMKENTPEIHMLVKLLSMIAGIYNVSTTKNLVVKSFNKPSNERSQFQLEVFDKSVNCSLCNTKNIANETISIMNITEKNFNIIQISTNETPCHVRKDKIHLYSNDTDAQIEKSTTEISTQFTQLNRESNNDTQYKMRSFVVTFCKPLIYKIPSDLFKDSLGDDLRNLDVIFTNSLGQSMNRSSWIQLDAEGLLLYGLMSIDEYKKMVDTKLQYKLMAINKKGDTRSTNINIIVPHVKPEIFFDISIKVENFYHENEPKVQETIRFLWKIKYFFQKETALPLVVVSVLDKTKLFVKLAVTDCLDKQNICEKVLSLKNILNTRLQDKLQLDLKRSLSPEYILDEIQIEDKTKCGLNESYYSTERRNTRSMTGKSLRILNKVSIIKVYTTMFLRFKIPNDTFFDSIDGYTPSLNLEMYHENSTTLSKTSWVQLNAFSQEINAYLYLTILEGENSKMFNFILVATNSRKQSVNMSIKLLGIRKFIPKGGLLMQFESSEYHGSILNNLQILHMFIEKLISFAKLHYSIEIKYFYYSRGPPGKFLLALQTDITNDVENRCNKTEVRRVTKVIESWGEDVNPFLMTNVLPEVYIQNITTNVYGNCLENTYVAPEPKIQVNVPIFKKNMQTLYTSNSEVFKYKIPENIFYDLQDGSTRNLTLTLLQKTKVKLPSNSWIYLTSDQSLLATISSENMENKRERQFFFLLRATNRRGMFVDVNITIVAKNSFKKGYPVIILNGLQFFRKTQTDAEILGYILENIFRYMRDTNGPKKISLISFKRYENQNKFSMALSYVATKTIDCNNNNPLEQTYSRFLNEKGQVNPYLSNALSPNILLLSGESEPGVLCNFSSNTSKLTLESQNSSVQSLNTPPRINIDIKPIEVALCQIMENTIPENTFVDKEQGYTKALDINLQNMRKQVVQDSSWVQWNQDRLTIYGVFYMDNLNLLKRNYSRYFLTAHDHQHSKVSAVIKFLFPRNAMEYNFKVHIVVLPYSNNQREVDIDILFVKKINQLFSNEYSIQMTNKLSSKTSSAISYSFIVCNIKYHPCPSEELNRIVAILTMFGNVPTNIITAFLKPEFVVLNVTFEYFGPCKDFLATVSTKLYTLSNITQNVLPTTATKSIKNSSPILKINIPILRVPQCTRFHYIIPKDTFYDNMNELTRKLHFSIEMQGNHPLKYDSWIQFNSSNQYLYGYVKDKDIEGESQKISIIATNLKGYTVEQKLILKLPKLKPALFYFDFVFSPQNFNENDNRIIAILHKRFSSFNTRLNAFRVIGLTRHRYNIFTLRWTTCNSSNETCKKNELPTLKKLFYIQGTVLKLEFLNALYPDINVFQMTFHSTSECTSKRSKTSKPRPTISETARSIETQNLPPTVLNSLPSLNMSTCQKFIYPLPEDTFFDVEDGLTSNLKVEIFDQNMEPLSNNSWLEFDDINQILEGVITDSDKKNQSSFLFNIVAVDKEGLSSAVKLIVKPENKENMINDLKLELHGTVYQDVKQSSLNLLIYDHLQNFLNISSLGSGIRIYNSEIYRGYKNKLKLTWGICSFVCNENNIDKLRKGLFTYDTTPNVKLAVLMKPAVILTSFKILSNNTCPVDLSVHDTRDNTPISELGKVTHNTPPIIFIPVPLITVKMCETFQFDIPENTCYDSQDGFTPNLRLKLAYENFTFVGKDSWVQIDQSKHIIYGHLKVSDLKLANDGVFTYQLVCIDSSDMLVSEKLHIAYQKLEKKSNYEIQMKSYVYLSSTLNHIDIQIKWMNKLNLFFTNETFSTNIQVTEFKFSTSLYPQIIVTWYFCSIENSCGKIGRDMKKKLFDISGTLKSEVAEFLMPEFVIISGKLLTFLECPWITTTENIIETNNSQRSIPNKPPKVIINPIIIDINSCEEINYQIPSNTFYDNTDGYTPNLQLEMYNCNNKTIDPSCYIQFNKTTQTIHGIFVYQQYLTDSMFHLFAYNSKGLKATSIIRLRLKEMHKNRSHIFSMVGSIYREESNIYFLAKFLKQISVFYNDTESHISFLTILRSSNQVKLQWINCTIISTCSSNKLSKVQKIILPYKEIVNTYFIEQLAPTFFVTSLVFSLDEKCKADTVVSQLFTTSKPSMANTVKTKLAATQTIKTVPLVQRPLPFLKAFICNSFSYRIPEDTFFDQEDGNTRNLHVELLTINEKKLPKTSWIQFVESSQVVYGNLQINNLNNQVSHQNFILKATDSDDFSVTTLITVVLPAKPDVIIRFNLTVSSFFDSETPDLPAQLFLASKLSLYFNDIDVRNILALLFLRTEKETFFSWTNCSFIGSSCNVQQFSMVAEKFVNTTSNIIELKKVLSPHYYLVNCYVEIIKPCQNIAKSSPSNQSFIQPTTSITITYPQKTQRRDRKIHKQHHLKAIDVQLCEILAYHIPIDIFKNEDKITGKLNFALKSIDGNKLRKTSWVQFNPRLQVIFGVLKVEDVIHQPAQGYRYLLQANSDTGAFIQRILPINIASHPTNIGFYVEMEINTSAYDNLFLVNDLFQLIRKTKLFLGDTQINSIKTVNIYYQPNSSNAIIFSWTNCTVSFEACPIDLIEYLRDKLFDEHGNVKNSLNDFFLPLYSIKRVELVKQNVCDPNIDTYQSPVDDSPKVVQRIKPILIKKCSFLSILIPQETFLDKKDGLTRNLHLSLHFPNSSLITASYWLRFSTEEQKITGLPMKDISNRSPQKTYSFKLKATDSDGLSNYTTIKIVVNQNYGQSLQNISMKMIINLQLHPSIESVQERLINRIFQYYGDPDQRYIQIEELTKSGNKVVVIFSNCSVNQFPCSKNVLKDLQLRIVNTDGDANKSFKNIFLPEFSLMQVNVSQDESCFKSTPAMTTSKPSSNIGKRLAGTNHVLTIVGHYCGNVEYHVSKDISQNLSRNVNKLTIYSLHYADGMEINCHSWLQFSPKKQLIFGTLIRNRVNAPKKYLLRQEATDGDHHYTDVNIEVLPDKPIMSYRVAISFLSNLDSICEAEFIYIFKSKLLQYFNRQNNRDIVIIYFSRGGTNRLNHLIFSNCSLLTDKCDYLGINFMRQMIFKNQSLVPNPNFLKAMKPEFSSLSVLDEKIGNCQSTRYISFGKVPEYICIPTCGELTYNLYAQKIFNYNDTDIDNIFIEFTQLNGSKLNQSSWIYYSQEEKTIFALATKKMVIDPRQSYYSFLLTAYHPSGTQNKTTLNFKICGNIPKYYKVFTLKVKCRSKVEYGLAVLRKKYTTHSTVTSNSVMDLLSLDNLNVRDNEVSVMISQCSLKHGEILLKNLLPMGLNSSCQILSIKEDYPPIVKYPMLYFNYRFCKENTYLIPDDLFYDKKDGSLRRLNLSIQFSNTQQIREKYWIALDKPRLALNIIPKEITKEKEVLESQLLAKDSKGLISSVPLTITVLPYPQNITFIQMAKIKIYSNVSNIEKARTYFRKMNSFMKSSENYSILSLSHHRNSNFVITYGNCLHTRPKCPYADIKKLSKFLKTKDDRVKGNFVMYMFPFSLVEKIKFIKRGPCLSPPNENPITLKDKLEIHIPLCGYLKYQIHPDTFFDKEDGWTRNLTVSTTFMNNCWFEYSARKQTLYAITSDVALQGKLETNFEIPFFATDSQDGTANITIILHMKSFQKSSFEIALLLEVADDALERSCLEEKLHIINIFGSLYNSYSSVSMKSVRKSNDNNLIEITITNCTLQYEPCNYKVMDYMINSIEKEVGTFQERFLKLLHHEFVPRYLAKHKDNICLDENNNPPMVTKKLNIPTLSVESCVKIPLSNDLILDKEDGGLNQLSTQLFHNSGAMEVNKLQWISLSRDKRYMHITGTDLNTKEQPYDGYKFLLVATDSRNKQANISFTVKFDSAITKSPFFTATERIDIGSNISVLPELLCQWKHVMELKFNFSIKIINFASFNETLITLNWTKLSTDSESCDFENVNLLRMYIKNTNNRLLLNTSSCFGAAFVSETVDYNRVDILGNPCQEMSYQLTSDTFFNRDIGNFSDLQFIVKQSYPKTLSETITFNTTIKTFIGFLLLDFLERYKYIEYSVTAINTHGHNFTSKIKIRSENELFNGYQFEILLDSKSKNKTNREILKQVSQKVSKKIKDDVIFTSFKKSCKTDCEYLIRFSTCNLINTNSNLTVYENIYYKITEPEYYYSKQRVLFTDETTAAQYLSIVSTKCEEPASDHKVIKKVKPVLIDICKEPNFVITVSDLVFTNKHRSSTKLITIENLFNYDWISFDKKRKMLSFRPSIKEIENQPRNGYEIKVGTFRSQECSESKRLFFSIIGRSQVQFVINIQLHIVSYQHQNVFHLNEYIIKKLKQLHGNEGNYGIRLYSISFDRANIRNLNYSFYYCHAEKDFCTGSKYQKYLDRFGKDNSISNDVVKIFSPDFKILNISGVMLTSCNSTDVKKRYFQPQVNFSLTYFEPLVYNNVENLFIRSDSSLYKRDSFKVHIKNKQIISKEKILHFDNSQNKLYIFITVEQREIISSNFVNIVIEQAIPHENNVSITLKIRLPDLIMPYYIIENVVSINDEVRNTVVESLIKFTEKVNNYLQFNKTSLILAYKIQKQFIHINWTTKFFLDNTCNSAQIQHLLNMVTEKNNGVNLNFATALQPEFLVHKINIKMLTDCASKSHATNVINTINITVSTCGNFQKKIPKIKGSQIELMHKNFSKISRDYWIQYDAEQNMIYGIPPYQIFLKVTFPLYLVLAEEKKSKTIAHVKISQTKSVIPLSTSSNTEIRVKIECSNSNYYLLNTKTLISLLSILAILSNETINNVHLKSTATLAPFHWISWRFCDNAKVSENFSKQRFKVKDCFINKIDVITESLAYMEGNFNKIDLKEKQSPVILNSIPDVSVHCGIPLKFPIARNTFFDMQNEFDLKLELLNSDGIPFNETYAEFVTNFNETYILYTLSINRCKNLSTENLNLLKATDEHGNYVLDSFLVKSISQAASCCISISTNVKYDIDTSWQHSVYNFAKNLKTNVYSDQKDEIVLMKIDVKKHDSTVLIEFGNKTITNETCTKSSADFFLKKTFGEDGSKKPFINGMVGFSVKELEKKVNKACNKTTFRTSEAIESNLSSGDQISSGDWYLYFLPLFIIAFILLTVALYYYLCKYCYHHCFGEKGRKDDVTDVTKSELDITTDENKDNRESYSHEDRPIDIKHITTSIEEIQEVKGIVDNNNGIPTRKKNIKPRPTVQEHNKRITFADNSFHFQEDLGATNSAFVDGNSIENIDHIVSVKDNMDSGIIRSRPFKKIYQRKRKNINHQMRNAALPGELEVNEERRESQLPLKLPNIPAGPPPPYSPPRKHRIFRQNFLPRYYERYTKPSRNSSVVSYADGELSFHKPKEYLRVPKRRYLPNLRRNMKYKSNLSRHRLSAIRTLTEIQSEPSSMLSSEVQTESQIEIPALVRGKRSLLKKLFRRNHSLSLEKTNSLEDISDAIYDSDSSCREMSCKKSNHSVQFKSILPSFPTTATITRHHPYKKTKMRIKKPSIINHQPFHKADRRRNIIEI